MKKDSQEWKDWCDVYEYFRKDILGYSDSMKLPKHAVLRLKGLSEGKFMANKKQKAMASYSFKTILITMKMCKGKISGYMDRNKNNFKDERHKINGIFTIIESEINNIVLRLEQADKAKKRTKDLKFDHHKNGAEYKTKKKNKNSKLDNIW